MHHFVGKVTEIFEAQRKLMYVTTLGISEGMKNYHFCAYCPSVEILIKKRKCNLRRTQNRIPFENIFDVKRAISLQSWMISSKYNDYLQMLMMTKFPRMGNCPPNLEGL